MLEKNQKKKSPELKPVSERIIELILSDCASVLSKAEIEIRLKFLLIMLTNNQKKATLEKLKRCSLYIEKIDKGFDESRVKSILKNKHKISRQYIEEACEPCKSFLEIRERIKNVK